MTQHVCSCHCGGNLFYKHIHAESCALSRHGDEAPRKTVRDYDNMREREYPEQDLERQVADLTAKLAAGRQWTNEQPRTPGWYWWKGRPDVCPDVHYVSEQDIAEGNPPGLWCGPLEAPR